MGDWNLSEASGGREQGAKDRDGSEADVVRWNSGKGCRWLPGVCALTWVLLLMLGSGFGSSATVWVTALTLEMLVRRLDRDGMSKTDTVYESYLEDHVSTSVLAQLGFYIEGGRSSHRKLSSEKNTPSIPYYASPSSTSYQQTDMGHVDVYC